MCSSIPISHCYWHLVGKNANLNIDTDILVVKNSNFHIATDI